MASYEYHTDEQYKNMINNLKEELHADLKEDNYVYFRMPLQTGYEWGPGWGSDMSKKADFYKEVERIPEQLARLGFSIKTDQMFGTDHIIVDRTPTDVYVHPMELSGYATKDEINALRKAFSEMSSVSSVGDADIETQYVFGCKNPEAVFASKLSELSCELAELLKYLKEAKISFSTLIDDYISMCKVAYIGEYRYRDRKDDEDVRYIKYFQTSLKKLGLL